jgi:hypothetical protein
MYVQQEDVDTPPDATKQRYFSTLNTMRGDEHASALPTKFRSVLEDQMALVIEKQRRDGNNRSILNLEPEQCGCDAPPPTSPQMGCFRSWPDLQTFYLCSMALRTEQLRIVRIYKRPEERQLFNFRGQRRYAEERNQMPTAGQEYLFLDELATVHLFAEQTDHCAGCLYWVQVRAIVDTNVLSPLLADKYFDL